MNVGFDPFQNGTENFSGPTVTKSGLVFVTGTRDKKLRAFDATSGTVTPTDVLGSWSVPQPFMDYVIQNGSEFAILQNIWDDYDSGALNPADYSAPTSAKLTGK